MYIRELRVRELRCLARARAEFRHPDRPDSDKLAFPNVNLLLGTNGGGKSTVLKAIALAAISPALGNETRDSQVPNLVRKGSDSDCEICASLHLHADEGPDASIDPRLLMRIWQSKTGESLAGNELPEQLRDAWARTEGPGFFLVAYGATRTAPVPAPGHSALDEAETPLFDAPDSSGAERQLRIRNLLHDRTPLVSLEEWLEPVDRPRKDHLLQVINELLPPDTKFEGKQEGGRFVLEHRGVEVPFSALSDGLRSYLAWVCDLLFWLHAVTPAERNVTDIPGVVLVDEIDQRLHPRWQQRVIPTVASVFPRLQIFASSHSPLVAGSLHHHNLFLLEPDSDARGQGAQRIRTLEEEVFGRTADRILQGSFFELESTRSDEFRARLRQLIEDARKKKDTDVAARFLRALAGLE